MKDVFRFLASPSGRIVRIAAGIVLIVIGLAGLGDAIGWILAIIGLVPLAAGVFDWCVLAPLFNLPFTGGHLRRTLEEERVS